MAATTGIAPDPIPMPVSTPRTNAEPVPTWIVPHPGQVWPRGSKSAAG